MRNEGLSFGGLSHKLISPRARIILLSFVYFYLLLIAGAFGNVVVSTAIGLKAAPMAWLLLTIGGILAGQMIYRWRKDIILTTVVTVVIALAGIALGTAWPSDQIIGPNLANSRCALGYRRLCFLLLRSSAPHLEVCTPHQLCGFLHRFPGAFLRDHRGSDPSSQFYAPCVHRFQHSDRPPLAHHVRHHSMRCYLWLAQHRIKLRHGPTT